MRYFFLLILILLFNSKANSQVPEFNVEYDSAAIAQFLDSMTVFYDSVESTIDYQKGEIEILNGAGKLNIPVSFKFISGDQSRYILSELYGNPEDSSIIGIIMPEEVGVTYGEGYMFVLYYKAIGYVKDDDAQQINYDDLLDIMRKDALDENKLRISEGLETYRIVGWAKRPDYNANQKCLSWAKELKFDSDTENNTLNYSILILGRYGVLTMNAIATMTELKQLQSEENTIAQFFSFTDGNRYSDFDPSTDRIAQWSIGSLVSGKIEEPQTFWMIASKYLKGIGIIVLIGAVIIWRIVVNRRKKEVSTNS